MDILFWNQCAASSPRPHHLRKTAREGSCRMALANSFSIKPKYKTATWFEDLCCPVKLTLTWSLDSSPEKKHARDHVGLLRARHALACPDVVACIDLANACADGAALRTLRWRHNVHYSTDLAVGLRDLCPESHRYRCARKKHARMPKGRGQGVLDGHSSEQ